VVQVDDAVAVGFIGEFAGNLSPRAQRRRGWIGRHEDRKSSRQLGNLSVWCAARYRRLGFWSVATLALIEGGRSGCGVFGEICPTVQDGFNRLQQTLHLVLPTESPYSHSSCLPFQLL
jgi:hypothetical protein